MQAFLQLRAHCRVRLHFLFFIFTLHSTSPRPVFVNNDGNDDVWCDVLCHGAVHALANMKSRREHSSEEDDWSPPADPLPIYQQRYNYLT